MSTRPPRTPPRGDLPTGVLTPEAYLQHSQQQRLAEEQQSDYQTAVTMYPDLFQSLQTADMGQSELAPFSIAPAIKPFDPEPPPIQSSELSPFSTVGTPIFPVQDPTYVVGAETGAYRYSNGVIADPNTGDVFFPTAASYNPAEIEGSAAWLVAIQDTWKPHQVELWRKRLFKMGYLENKEGPMAKDLLDALELYHRTRYLNGGKVLRAKPSDATTLTAKETYDTDGVRNEVRAMLLKTTGDFSEAEVDEWTDWAINRVGSRLLRKGKNPELLMGKVENAIMQDPQTQYLRESTEENTQVRDGLLSTISAMNRIEAS